MIPLLSDEERAGLEQDIRDGILEHVQGDLMPCPQGTNWITCADGKYSLNGMEWLGRKLAEGGHPLEPNVFSLLGAPLALTKDSPLVKIIDPQILLTQIRLALELKGVTCTGLEPHLPCAVGRWFRIGREETYANQYLARKRIIEEVPQMKLTRRLDKVPEILVLPTLKIDWGTMETRDPKTYKLNLNEWYGLRGKERVG